MFKLKMPTHSATGMKEASLATSTVFHPSWNVRDCCNLTEKARFWTFTSKTTQTRWKPSGTDGWRYNDVLLDELIPHSISDFREKTCGPQIPPLKSERPVEESCWVSTVQILGVSRSGIHYLLTADWITPFSESVRVCRITKENWAYANEDDHHRARIRATYTAPWIGTHKEIISN